jgi:urease accessory protein
MALLHVRELATSGPATDRLELPFDLRSRSRLRTALTDGRELGIALPRGTILRDGALLRGVDGSVIEVRAQAEDVSMVRAHGTLLARLAYHLGNRHVAVQLGTDHLCYVHDPVLDDMVRRLGAEPVRKRQPFEPEAGAYDSKDGRP